MVRKVVRDHSITVTLTKSEYDWVVRYSEFNGLPMSTAMRYLALSQLNFLSRIQYWNAKQSGKSESIEKVRQRAFKPEVEVEVDSEEELEYRDDWKKYYYREGQDEPKEQPSDGEGQQRESLAPEKVEGEITEELDEELDKEE